LEARRFEQSTAEAGDLSDSWMIHRPVVGRRRPKRASQGAFLVTCRSSFLHQIDCQVRQLPSRASVLAKSACSHRRSQNRIRLVFTPALGCFDFLGMGECVVDKPEVNPAAGRRDSIFQIQSSRLSRGKCKSILKNGYCRFGQTRNFATPFQ